MPKSEPCGTYHFLIFEFMKLYDLLKSAKDLLVGHNMYDDESYSLSNPEKIDDDNDVEGSDSRIEYVEENDDYNYNDNDDEALSAENVSEFESALHQFYSRLPKKEIENPDIDRITDKIQDLFFEHKIKNPAKALNDAYAKWVSTKKERAQKSHNARAVIIDMLSRYDTLSQEEKEQLSNYESPFYLGKLKKSDSQSVKAIVQSWFDNKAINEEKCDLLNLIGDSDAVAYIPYFEIKDLPLTEADYKQLLAIFNFDEVRYSFDDYKEVGDYCKRYWAQPGNEPHQVETDDLIVNRPCYMATEIKLCTPHFHLGKRYFDEADCFQKVKIYLFADKLEYICDGGHVEIELSEIIDISVNDWAAIDLRWRDINHWREVEKGYYVDATNNKPCPEAPEPELLEITCRNDRKFLFTYITNNSELLVLRALLFHFIKNI